MILIFKEMQSPFNIVNNSYLFENINAFSTRIVAGCLLFVSLVENKQGMKYIVL